MNVWKIVSLYMCVSIYAIHGIQFPLGPGTPLRDLLHTTSIIIHSIENKVCELQVGISPDFSGTFTMLDAIEDKWCTVLSKVDLIDTQVETITVSLETVESYVDVIESVVDNLTNELSGIRVDDFGGTWTVIDGIQTTLCGKFDTLSADLNDIDQTIDTISGSQLAAFLGTCTTIQEISRNVSSNMETLCNIALNTASDIDTIDSLIDMLEMQNNTVCSKIELLQITVDEYFAGTFTALESVESKACVLDDAVSVLIDLSSTATAIAALEDKICSIDARVDIIEVNLLTICDNLETIESFIDPISVKFESVENTLNALNNKATTVETVANSIVQDVETIDSIVDVINPRFATVESKICLVESIVDELSATVNTIDSSIDSATTRLTSIENNVCVLEDVYGSAQEKLCTVESKVDTIGQVSVSVLDTISMWNSLESRIDILDIASSLNKACTVESLVDRVNIQVNESINNNTVIESTVDNTVLTVCSVESLLDAVRETSYSIESSIDRIDSTLNSIESKVCLVESNFDIVVNGVREVVSSVDNIEINICALSDDFNETWTVLTAIESKACVVDLLVDTIESKVDFVSGSGASGDFSGTFTVLDLIQAKICSSDSIVDTLLPMLPDISGTFTALEVLVEKSCTIESALDFAVVQLSTNDSQFADVIDCLGTEITDADVGTTGFTISSAGRYFLGESITYSPGVSSSAVTISTDNVTLDMCDKVITQGNTTASVVGITVGAVDNVTVKNGTVRDMRGNNIAISSSASGVLLQDLFVITAGDGANSTDGINISAADTITINRVLVSDSGRHGIHCAGAVTDVIIQDSMIVDNTTDGIALLPTSGTTQRVCIQRCVCNNNGSDGIDVAINTATAINQIIVQDCCCFSNTSTGIRFDTVTSSVIKNCVSSSNGTDGISLNLPNDIEVLENVCSNNTDDGINITNGSAEDCSIQGNVLVLNGGDNYQEGIGAGPHTVLSNFALHGTQADNYAVNGTTMNKSIIDQGTGTFGTYPGKWRNISMTT